MNARVRVRQGVKQGRLGCARAVDGLWKAAGTPFPRGQHDAQEFLRLLLDAVGEQMRPPPAGQQTGDESTPAKAGMAAEEIALEPAASPPPDAVSHSSNFAKQEQLLSEQRGFQWLALGTRLLKAGLIS